MSGCFGCPPLISLQVLEVRPVIDWNKGKAVKFLLDSLGIAPSFNLSFGFCHRIHISRSRKATPVRPVLLSDLNSHFTGCCRVEQLRRCARDIHRGRQERWRCIQGKSTKSNSCVSSGHRLMHDWWFSNPSIVPGTSQEQHGVRHPGVFEPKGDPGPVLFEGPSRGKTHIFSAFRRPSGILKWVTAETFVMQVMEFLRSLGSLKEAEDSNKHQSPVPWEFISGTETVQNIINFFFLLLQFFYKKFPMVVCFFIPKKKWNYFVIFRVG